MAMNIQWVTVTTFCLKYVTMSEVYNVVTSVTSKTFVFSQTVVCEVIYMVSQKMTPMLFCQNFLINGTFSAKCYTRMYSTKIHMLTIFGD